MRPSPVSGYRHRMTRSLRFSIEAGKMASGTPAIPRRIDFVASAPVEACTAARRHNIFDTGDAA